MQRICRVNRILITSVPRRRRRAQALLELAVVAFLVTLLLAIILAIGMLLFAKQALEQAVDVGAQELARLPLPPTIEFPALPSQPGMASASQRTSTDPNPVDKLFHHTAVRQRIFDESYLVVDVSAGSVELPSGPTLDERLQVYFAQAPLINRLLRSVMIYEEVTLAGEGQARQLIRYPGALVRNTATAAPNGHEDLTVLIPVVRERTGIAPMEGGPSSESLEIEWRSVLEEIRARSVEEEADYYGPFSLVLPSGAMVPEGFQPGFVAIRVNYPFQAASLLGYQYRHGDGSIDGRAALGEDVDNLPIGADDLGVTTGVTPPAPYELIVTANAGIGPHAGRLGMGRQYALGGVVRPFRRVLSAQAIYRREVFE